MSVTQITDEHCLELAQLGQKGPAFIKRVRYFMFNFEDFVSCGLDPTAGVVCANNCGKMIKFTKEQENNSAPWSMVYLVSPNAPVCNRCWTKLMIRGMRLKVDQRKSKG